MKKLLYLIVLHLFISNGFCQHFGMGIGGGVSGVSLTLGGIGSSRNSLGNKNTQYFGMFGSSSILNDRSEDNTYDFSETVFDDEDRGKIKESFWFVGGQLFNLNERNKVFVGGGFSLTHKYYKRYDSSEILSDDGIYFINDDKSKEYKPTFYLGFSNKLDNNNFGLKYFGLYVNLHPFDISIIGWL